MTTSKIDLKSALERARAGLEQHDAMTAFWYTGEISEAIKGASINSTVATRVQRIAFYMKKSELPFNPTWLMRLVLWHKVKGGSIKTPVMALKYTLLDDAMRRNLAWTKAMDDHVEALALEGYQEHKRKADR